MTADKTDKYFTASFQYSPIDQAENIANKARVMAIMRAMAEEPIEGLPEIARESFAADVALNVTHPINELTGIGAGLEQLVAAIAAGAAGYGAARAFCRRRALPR